MVVGDSGCEVSKDVETEVEEEERGDEERPPNVLEKKKVKGKNFKLKATFVCFCMFKYVAIILPP